MKIVISSNGKKVLKMTKKEWASIGKKAGWEEWDEESDFYNPSKEGFYGTKEYQRIHKDPKNKDEDEDENKEEKLYNSWVKVEQLPDPLKSNFMSFCNKMTSAKRLLIKITKLHDLDKPIPSRFFNIIDKYTRECEELKKKIQGEATTEMIFLANHLVEGFYSEAANFGSSYFHQQKEKDLLM